jgi:hypothetical protein
MDEIDDCRLKLQTEKRYDQKHQHTPIDMAATD